MLLIDLFVLILFLTAAAPVGVTFLLGLREARETRSSEEHLRRNPHLRVPKPKITRPSYWARKVDMETNEE